jgi:predicted nucleic acid-binding protein
MWKLLTTRLRASLFAAQLGLTTYDAAYVDLAQRRKLSLATLDTRLRAACNAAHIDVL